MAQPDTDATPDGQLELKKRARRRLVGAAALALLAVIILPLVMDHEPRRPVQDIQVRIPSQETGVAAKIVSTKPDPTPLPPAPPDSAADDKPETVPAAASADIPRDQKPAVQAVEKPIEKPAAKATEKPVEKPAEKPAAKPAEKQSEKPVAKPAAKTDEARARAALAGQEGGSEPWLVLIGAYKDEANVKQLTGKLKQLGVPVITERFDSPQGARTRVRAGPFKTREAAEQAAAKMKKIGVGGLVKQSGK